MSRKWVSFIIYSKNEEKLQKVAKMIIDRTMGGYLTSAMQLFNMCFYADDLKHPHVSLRYFFRSRLCQTTTEAAISGICTKMKLKWRKQQYAERQIVKIAYSLATFLAVKAMKCGLSEHYLNTIVHNAELRAQLIHGIMNIMRVGYLQEMRSYGLSTYQYATKLMAMKKRV